MDCRIDRIRGRVSICWKSSAVLFVVLTTILPPVIAQSSSVPSVQVPLPAEPVPIPPVRFPTPPTAPPDITIEPLRGAVPPGAELIRMTLQELVIEGATIYSDEELKSVYGDLLGVEISVLRLFQIAEEIQEKYRNAGYLLTRVIVPAQMARDGVFRLRVIEGFVTKVTVEGEIGPVRERVQAYLDKVTLAQPVRIQDLERYLLLVTDIPGMSAAGVLRPDTEQVGASELAVKVVRKPFEGSVLANNRGSKFTGPKRAAIAVQQNAATAFGERAEVFLFAAEDNEEKFGQLTYEQLVGSEGLKVGLSAAISPSEPGHTLADLELETESLSAKVFFAYPVIRSRSKNLYLRGGLDAIRSTVESTLVGNERISRDHLRVLYVDATYEFEDRFDGQSMVGLGLRRGLRIFGASDPGDADLSRSEGQSDALVLRARGQRYQPLTGEVGLFFAANAQYAFDPLLADEEFSVGGELFGRGYDPSELKGDHGIGVTAEARYSKRTDLGPLQGYQAYGFYDLGAVWNKDSGQGRDSLASAGIGVRTQFQENLFLDLEVAKPLTKTPTTEDDKDPRFIVQLLAHF